MSGRITEEPTREAGERGGLAVERGGLAVERGGATGARAVAVAVAVEHDAVMQALRSVPEPCSIAMGRPIDICEMGLIEQIEIEGDSVGVTLVLTDPSCVHFSAMRRYITDALLELDGVEQVLVRMSTTQLWTPDRLEHKDSAAAA